MEKKKIEMKAYIYYYHEFLKIENVDFGGKAIVIFQTPQ